MDDHFAKFGFLAVVVLVVLFSRAAYFSNQSIGPAAITSTAIRNATVPFFVLPAISASNPVSVAPSVTQETSTQAARTDPPRVADAASLVADLRTGTVYEAQSAGKRWPTASITKLMTAVIAFDKLDLNTRISITPNMFAVDPVDENHLVIGGTYTVGDLLHAMLLPSSNVAAQAMADYYGENDFLDLMNAKAASWGMTSTFFGDPSGLSATNQSTASDFLKLAQHIYADYPQIFAITRTPTYTITNLASNTTVTLKSINDFAGEPDFIGGKTGYTDEAAQNLLSIFNNNGSPVFVVVLGTNNRFGDTEKLYNWFKANIPA